MGLEGLPVNDGEVYGFDIVRDITRNASDLTGLVILWAVAFGVAALALWGRSLGLGIFAAVAALAAGWWTVGKWRSWRDAHRQMQTPKSN